MTITMGIQGLLPLLKSIQLPITIAELSGNTVGVDAYCWLHKGVYGCALQLAEGKESDVYINYVMRRVNMMLYYKVKPVMVFDGGYLPSKREKETERRNKRKENRTQGLAHLKSGNRTKALECFQKSIDISPEMAYNVIKACREKGVDCIVAPYEADAQLAYLMKAGITQFTISEDSDLLVYGCDKVIYKMDANGSGLLINIKNLPKLTSLRMESFTEMKFRWMCILSGCDYLQSVKGLGLITAHKLLCKHSTVNKLIGTLRLNNKLRVPKDYEARFAEAEQTFLYQIVFDPNTNKLIPLNPMPDDLQSTQLHFAGHNGRWTQVDAVQLALGNINPITGKKMGNIKAAKVIMPVGNEHVLDTDRPRKKAFPLPPPSSSSCSQNKGPHSVLSSNGEYEATKNLNGSFKETKSSEKANTPFVTPVRTKRMRSSETEDSVSDSPRLSKLYSTTDVVEDGDEKRQRQSIQIPNNPFIRQPIKRPNNPFRSPVSSGKQQTREHVVSRYFGLAGMETEEKPSTLNEANYNSTLDEGEYPVAETPSQSSTDSSTPSQDTLNVTTESQKSDHSPQNMGRSPSENSSPLSNHTTPRASKTRDFFFVETKVRAETETRAETEMRAEIEMRAETGTHAGTRAETGMIAEATMRAETGVRAETEMRAETKSVHIKLRNSENREPPKKKIRSSQTSLHKFAFVKNSSKMDVEKSEQITSPNREVLGDFTINCQFDRVAATAEPRVNDEEKCGEMKEEYTKVLNSSEVENEHRNIFDGSQGKSQNNVTHERKPRQIVLRKKPSTGLSRCRPVGLSRPKASEKKKINAEQIPTLMKYFAYRGRPTITT